VTWVPNQDALKLGKRATLLSSAPSPNTAACTLEIFAKPALDDDSSTLLAFYGSRGTIGLSLHQSLDDLRVNNEIGTIRPAARYVNQVFRAGRLVFIGIVTNAEGTAVYVDGALARVFPGFRSTHPCSGPFVVGDSPRDNDTWQGELRGLAIYRQAISSAQIASDYLSWTRDSRFSGSAASLYLFNERSGRIVHDQGISGIDLQIPERYVIVRQILLESPLRAFEPTKGYVEDLAINVLGFAPFGITLYAFLFASGWKRHIGIRVVMAGLLTSLMIETLQSYLPTRDSDLTDVLTNTLGTWLGVYLISRVLKLWYAPVRKA
jgi:VanZ family protein